MPLKLDETYVNYRLSVNNTLNKFDKRIQAVSMLLVQRKSKTISANERYKLAQNVLV